MRTRAFNILTGLTMVVLSVIGLLIMSKAPNTTPFGMWSIIVAVAVSAGMLVRTCFSSLALWAEEKTLGGIHSISITDDDELMEFTVCVKKEKATAERFISLYRTVNGRKFCGGKAILTGISVLADSDGVENAYGYNFVGTREAYEQFVSDLKENATILDYLPITDELVEGLEDNLMEEYSDITEDIELEPDLAEEPMSAVPNAE